MSSGTKGKIDRLPFELREQVNRKLRDGLSAKKICDWLNADEAVLKILDEYFHEEPVNAQNLTNWRQGGYAKWLARQDQIDRTRELADWSVKLAQASGGNLADGAAQMLAGNILELLEQLDALKNKTGLTGSNRIPENNPENPVNPVDLSAIADSIDQLTASVARLRKGDQDARASTQRDRQLSQNDERIELDRKKLMRVTAETVLKAAVENRVQEISASNASHADKIEKLGKLIFEDLWK